MGENLKSYRIQIFWPTSVFFFFFLVLNNEIFFFFSFFNSYFSDSKWLVSGDHSPLCIVICVYGSCGWLFPSKPSSSKLVSLFNRQSGSFGRPNCAVYSLCVMGLNSNGIYTLTVPSNVNSNIFF